MGGLSVVLYTFGLLLVGCSVVMIRSSIYIDDRNPLQNEGFYVISMDEKETSNSRLAGFFKRWHQVCPDLKFVHCPSKFHKVRGRGLHQGFIDCFKRARADGVEVAWFFEDDAGLFDRDIAQGAHKQGFCKSDYRSLLTTALPADALLALLGGHHVDCVHAARHVEGTSISLQQLTMSAGSYAFGINGANNLQMLVHYFQKQLKANSHSLRADGLAHRHQMNPDFSLHKAAVAFKKSVYITSPLMIDHYGDGQFSITKQKAVRYEWEHKKIDPCSYAYD